MSLHICASLCMGMGGGGGAFLSCAVSKGLGAVSIHLAWAKVRTVYGIFQANR
jgi:hypothetical protein